MTELVRVLLEHAELTTLPGLLSANGYTAACRRNLRSWKAFQSGLSSEQSVRLDALLEQDGITQLLEIEATFQAGLSMGLELGRL